MKQLCSTVVILTALAFGPCLYAQKWEVGGAVGGSFFPSNSVINGSLSGDAGLDRGLAASVWLGNNSGRLFGGEIRYDYEHTNLKLTSSGTSASFGADTHAIHYDFLFHFTPKEARIRPFVAAGGGVKIYRGTGTEAAFQPLANLALLTKTNQTKPLVSVGAGVKFAVSSAIQLRAEVHDYLTPFPDKVIAPNQGSKIGGWLQDLVAEIGLSFTF